jgi:phenylpropionate dioxygenase-like ring-hydroxylating dioxygenase large terminal subunit
MGLAQSLPAWIYSDQAFFERERQTVFQTGWQVVCHVNDVPAPGDYQTLDLLDERVVTLRGEDGAVRSFHNACRHRAARLVDGAEGNCGHRLVCPYHAWSYTLSGGLRSVPRWQGFENLDLETHGLRPVDQEIWRGFVFVRFAPGLPSIAEMMAPYEAEIEPHGFETLQPQGRVTLRTRPVNWKNVADNYGDGLHIPVAHPGLTRLFGPSYAMEAGEWVDKLWGDITETPSTNWVERGYQGLLHNFDHLSPQDRRRWSYYRLWPSLAFDVYPDQVDFMQFIPVSPTETLVREIAYARPDARREVKIARRLNWRINRQVNAEDTVLIARVQEGMATSGYESGPLGPSEVCLEAFARRLRAMIPEASLPRAPAKAA